MTMLKNWVIKLCFAMTRTGIITGTEIILLPVIDAKYSRLTYWYCLVQVYQIFLLNIQKKISVVSRLCHQLPVPYFPFVT